MLLLCGGMPRSGTTWSFNVAAEILRGRGIASEKVNANHARALDAALSTTPERPTIVHFHDVTDALLQHLKESKTWITYSFRDPRDVTVSQMKLHDATLEEAIKMTAASTLGFARLIEGVPFSRVHYLPYIHVKDYSKAAIAHLGLSLGYIMGPDEVEAVHAVTTKEYFQKAMAKAKVSEHTIFTGKRAIGFDQDTLINDRHLQSGEHGRWKTELNPTQQARLESVFQGMIETVFEPPFQKRSTAPKPRSDQTAA